MGNLNLKHEYKGTHGRVAVYFVNRGSVPLQNLRINLIETPTQMSNAPAGQTGLALRITRVDKQLLSTLNPDQSFTHYLMLDLLLPFLQPPKYVVSFVPMGSTEAVSLPLTLPVILTKFARHSFYSSGTNGFSLVRDFNAYFSVLPYEKQIVGAPKLQTKQGFQEVLKVISGCNFSIEQLEVGKFLACTQVELPSTSDQGQSSQQQPVMSAVFCRIDLVGSLQVQKQQSQSTVRMIGLAVRSPALEVSNTIAHILGSYLIEADG